MLQLIQLKNYHSIGNASDHLSLRRGFLLIVIVIGCFGFGSPKAQAVNPPPDGGYGNQNTAEGTDALFSLTSGVWNVAVGFQSLHSDTSGNQNTATGYRALFSNVTGDHSTAFGSQALLNNTTGNDNVATGFSTLFTNTTGNRNTGVGFRTLLFTNADDNTAIGWNALFNNRTGVQNTAIGSGAVLQGSGSSNTAIGYQALNNGGTGGGNTANGVQALFSTTTGFANTATGYQALANNITGTLNTAVGTGALANNTTGYGNIALGDAAGLFLATGHDNIDIGNNGVSGESETTRIGNIQGQIYLAGIAGQIVGAGGTTCYVDNDGKWGVALSSRRFKTDIADMDTASEALLALRPVTFHYKPELDKTCIPQFGLVAEEVAQVNPDLVTRDAKGELSTVRYEAVNVMLLNEFLKEHREVEEQKATIAELKKDFGATIARLTARLDEQASQIQEVSTQLAAASPSRGGLELSKPALRVVNNQ